MMRKILLYLLLSVVALQAIQAQQRKESVKNKFEIGFAASFERLALTKSSDIGNVIGPRWSYGPMGQYVFHDKWKLKAGINYQSVTFNQIVERTYGYHVDPVLGIVSHVNITYKAFAMPIEFQYGNQHKDNRWYACLGFTLMKKRKSSELTTLHYGSAISQSSSSDYISAFDVPLKLGIGRTFKLTRISYLDASFFGTYSFQQQRLDPFYSTYTYSMVYSLGISLGLFFKL